MSIRRCRKWVGCWNHVAQGGRARVRRLLPRSGFWRSAWPEPSRADLRSACSCASRFLLSPCTASVNTSIREMSGRQPCCFHSCFFHECHTHICGQFVADFGLDHLWSVFDTGELQVTHILPVLRLHANVNIHFSALILDTHRSEGLKLVTVTPLSFKIHGSICIKGDISALMRTHNTCI